MLLSNTKIYKVSYDQIDKGEGVLVRLERVYSNDRQKLKERRYTLFMIKQFRSGNCTTKKPYFVPSNWCRWNDLTLTDMLKMPDLQEIYGD